MGRELIVRRKKFAVRETVSDKEIVTPWFSTKDELSEHLFKNGDSWGSKAGSLEIAKKFVETGIVPSMISCELGLLDNYNCCLLFL